MSDRMINGGYLVSWGFLEGEGYQASLPSASSSNQPTFQDLSMVLGSLLNCSHPSLNTATNSLFTCTHHHSVNGNGGEEGGGGGGGGGISLILLCIHYLA